MREFSYTITDEAGIHVRPAGELVKLIQPFACDVQIAVGEKSASLKKLFALMGMAVKQGDTVVVSANGIDEEKAIAAAEAFIKGNL